MQRTSVMDLRIGSHCTVPGCQQLDFLPFVCTSCHASLCLEHQSFAAHDCPSAPADRRAPDCPKCSRVVALLPNEEPAAALARHIGAGCQVTKTIADGPRCQAAGCRTRHNHTPVKCPHCNGSFCVAHRVAEDHACKRAPTPIIPARPARAVVQPAAKSVVTAKASSSEIAAPNMHKDDIFTIRLWLAALPADALPAAQRQRLNVQPILVRLNRRWSVGKAVDWICSQLGVRNDGSTRHRLVSLDQPQVVLNNLVLSQSGRVNDDGTQSPDLAHEAGVALVPESLISSMTQQHLQSLVSEVQSSVAANQSIGRRCANEVQKMLAGMLPTYVTARAQ